MKHWKIFGSIWHIYFGLEIGLSMTKKNSKDKYVKIIDGAYWARITYIDQQGKRRELKRRADNKTHAKELARQLLLELEQHGPASLGSAQMNFAQLADYYEEKYLIEPVYLDNRKIAGLRGAYEYKLLLKAIREYFANKKVRAITYGDIESFRLKRLATPTKQGKQRTLAAVNRELALLRRIFNIAHREGWINKSPFFASDKLISIADEKKRERILTKAEENLLLENCVGQRAHLKTIIICALDTGMRAGEIYSLKWQDVDLEQSLIKISALNTKTLQSRQVAITARLKSELLKLFEPAKSGDDLIFGVITARKSFDTLKSKCNLKDLRFHDLRHTAATRLIQAGIPLQEVGRILGHTQANTTYRYINLTVDTARRAASALDNFNQADSETDNEEDNYIS